MQRMNGYELITLHAEAGKNLPIPRGIFSGNDVLDRGQPSCVCARVCLCVCLSMFVWVFVCECVSVCVREWDIARQSFKDMCNFVTFSFNIFQYKATFQKYYYLIMCILNSINISLEMCGLVLDFMYNALQST